MANNELSTAWCYAAARDPRSRSGYTLAGHLYWGVDHDHPPRWKPRFGSLGFVELWFGRRYIGVCG